MKNKFLKSFFVISTLLACTLATAQAPQGGPPPGGGLPPVYPFSKLPDLPAGTFTARTTLSRSQLRKEYVDIPIGEARLRTWIEYPAGTDKAPIIVLLAHATGLEEWQQALADQLASEGFIAIVPDVLSGFGPKGGATEAFSGTDEIMRAMLGVSADETIRRYKAAWDYGMKLPRASGKSAAMGFGLGGGRTWLLAAQTPSLNAAVVFYASAPAENVLAKLQTPFLGFYGEDDGRFTAAVKPTQALMERLGKSYEAHIYPHATHGFLEYQDLGGNGEATAQSWPLAISFLNKYTK